MKSCVKIRPVEATENTTWELREQIQRLFSHGRPGAMTPIGQVPAGARYFVRWGT